MWILVNLGIFADVSKAPISISKPLLSAADVICERSPRVAISYSYSWRAFTYDISSREEGLGNADGGLADVSKNT